jgi:hypothetical protein
VIDSKPMIELPLNGAASRSISVAGQLTMLDYFTLDGTETMASSATTTIPVTTYNNMAGIELSLGP